MEGGSFLVIQIRNIGTRSDNEISESFNKNNRTKIMNENNPPENPTKQPFDVSDFLLQKNTPKVPVLPKTQQVSSSPDVYLTIAGAMLIVDDNDEDNTAEQLHSAMDIGDKYDVHCPFPGHDDENPSAFVSKQESGDIFVCCLSCQQKGFYSDKKEVKVSKGQITISSIDKEAIVSTLSADKGMRGVLADIVTHLPAIQCSDPGELEACHFVRNIKTNCIYPLAKVEGSLRLYHSGYWQKFESLDLQRFFVKRLIEKSCGTAPDRIKLLIDNVIHELLEEYHMGVELDDGQIAINLKNSILTIKDGVFSEQEQSQDFSFLYKLPYDYDPTVDTTFIRDFFLQSVEEEEALDVLLEFLGSTLISNRVLNMEKLMVLHGSGSNGKSVLLELIKQTLGDETVSTLELQQFSDDNKAQVTIGKLLNIGTELEARRLDSSLIKRLASAEPITVNRKYESAITIKTFPKLIFAANNLPDSSNDVSMGYFRRFLILPFNRQFNHEKKQKDFMQNLLEHRPAILRLILEGAARLLANRQFTYSPKIAEAGRKFEASVDSVRGFITDCAVELPKPESTAKFTANKVLYSTYEAYCVQEGIQAKKKQEFMKTLRSQGFGEHKSGDDRGSKAIVCNPPVDPRGDLFPGTVRPNRPVFGSSQQYLEDVATSPEPPIFASEPPIFASSHQVLEVPAPSPKPPIFGSSQQDLEVSATRPKPPVFGSNQQNIVVPATSPKPPVFGSNQQDVEVTDS